MAAKPSGKPAPVAISAEPECEQSKRLSSRVKAYNKLVQQSREIYIRYPNIARPKGMITLTETIKTVSIGK